MASAKESIQSILAKPEKTTRDLQEIIDQWHQELLGNEKQLLDHANQLNRKQQALNETTESIIQAQELLTTLEENLEQFQSSVDVLTKYNNALQENIEKLNVDSKTILPNIRANFKTDHDRSVTYDLMDSVDSDLEDLEKKMKRLHRDLRIDTDQSLLKTTDELQACFQDIDQLQETIKQIKL